MAATLVERLWAWLHDTFPERQIYIRSDGRVQFFTFGPSLQATLAGLTLVFLGWVAFTTVNVIFKDRIIATKDHRYQQMQSAYENRVADLQTSYDELNSALVSAEDRFKAKADELQTKQNTIARFLDRKHQVDALLGGLGSAANSAAPTGMGQPQSATESAVSAPPPPGASDDDSDADGGSFLQIMPQPVPAQPRTAKPNKASMLDFGGPLGRLAGALFGKRPSQQQLQAAQEADAFARHPALRVLAAETARIGKIGQDETALMERSEVEVADGIGSLRSVIRSTGIDADQFTQKYEALHGVGGPDIPLQDVRIQGISDRGFQDAYLKASAVLNEMDDLLGAMRHIPLTIPVNGAQFDRSSGFGPRVDPINGRWSFHPGVDFAGPWGSPVDATAPGVVVWAGPKGAYGNLVEIDHGLGIHTRYGHLSSILVRIGARIEKGTPIGRVGSTGHSTGPHVHYEVWYDNVMRNPSKFIEAGHHVL